MFKLNFFAFLLMGICVQTVYADDKSTALQETQTCLKNKTCDSAKTAAGKAADKKALMAVAGDVVQQQELYTIAADIMPFLLQQTGGDSEKMQALMLKAQSNPEGFFKSLPAEIQAKIKSAASAVEKVKTK